MDAVDAMKSTDIHILQRTRPKEKKRIRYSIMQQKLREHNAGIFMIYLISIE